MYACWNFVKFHNFEFFKYAKHYNTIKAQYERLLMNIELTIPLKFEQKKIFENTGENKCYTYS